MLEGIVRESTGKSATKALRKDGYLIANIFLSFLKNGWNYTKIFFN